MSALAAVIEYAAGLPDAERDAVRAAFRALPGAFGAPHIHAGLGIRKLDATHFECRAGISTRVIFKREGRSLIVQMLGTHDEVRAFLRNRR